MTKYQLISVGNDGINYMNVFDTADGAFGLLKEWLKKYNIEISWKDSGNTKEGFLYDGNPDMEDYAIPFCTPNQFHFYSCGIDVDKLCDDLKRDDLKYGLGPELKFYIVILE